MDEKQKLTNILFFYIFPSRAGRVMFIWCELEVRTESNWYQPNIFSGRVTRPNSTDEFSLA